MRGTLLKVTGPDGEPVGYVRESAEGRWTFADAPEVTVYIMPWMPRASELDQEAAG